MTLYQLYYVHNKRNKDPPPEEALVLDLNLIKSTLDHLDHKLVRPNFFYLEKQPTIAILLVTSEGTETGMPAMANATPFPPTAPRTSTATDHFASSVSSTKEHQPMTNKVRTDTDMNSMPRNLQFHLQQTSPGSKQIVNESLAARRFNVDAPNSSKALGKTNKRKHGNNQDSDKDKEENIFSADGNRKRGHRCEPCIRMKKGCKGGPPVCDMCRQKNRANQCVWNGANSGSKSQRTHKAPQVPLKQASPPARLEADMSSSDSQSEGEDVESEIAPLVSDHFVTIREDDHHTDVEAQARLTVPESKILDILPAEVVAGTDHVRYRVVAETVKQRGGIGAPAMLLRKQHEGLEAQNDGNAIPQPANVFHRHTTYTKRWIALHTPRIHNSQDIYPNIRSIAQPWLNADANIINWSRVTVPGTEYVEYHITSQSNQYPKAATHTTHNLVSQNLNLSATSGAAPHTSGFHPTYNRTGPMSFEQYRKYRCTPQQRKDWENMIARKVIQIDPEVIPNEAQRTFIKVYKGPVTLSLKPMIGEIVVEICDEDLEDTQHYFDQVWDFVLAHLPVNDNTINETHKQRLAGIKPGNPRPVTEADAIEFFFALKCLRAAGWHYKKAEHLLVNHVGKHILYLKDGIRWNDEIGRWYSGTSKWLAEWLEDKMEEDERRRAE